MDGTDANALSLGSVTVTKRMSAKDGVYPVVEYSPGLEALDAIALLTVAADRLREQFKATWAPLS